MSIKLTKRQQDMLWGVDGPYSEAKLIKEVRIMDDAVSRVFLTVEVSINPTTYELVKKHRNDKEFQSDAMVQQLLDHADYRGPKFGYVSMAYTSEYDGEVTVMVNAEKALQYAKECIIKMHIFVMGNIGVMRNTSMPAMDDEGFLEFMHEEIAAGRHVDHFKSALEKYVWYKEEFMRVFTNDEDPDAIFRFKVVYMGKKGVWREIEIQGKQTLEKFATAIVHAMGWNEDHMHGFTIPGIKKEPAKGTKYEGATTLDIFESHWEDDPFPTYKTNKVAVYQIDYVRHPKLEFIFDFGDGHTFEISIKGTRDKNEGDKKTKFPVVVDKRGIAPKQYR